MAESRIGIGGADDLQPFVDLLESAATWLWDRGIPQWPPGSIRAQESLLRERALAGHLVVAHSGSELVGGCILAPHPTPEWTGRTEPSLYLNKLVVARSHAGQGIARRVLAWCEDRAREQGASRLRLDCWEGSAKLRGFYSDCGYRELERVPSRGFSVRLFELELS
jgi:GNAT superfamily N-acetyltransferase